MKIRIINIDYNTFALACFISIPSLNNFMNEIVQKGMNLPSISPLLYGLLCAIGFLCYFNFVNGGTINKILLSIINLLLGFLFFSYVIYPEISGVFLSTDFNPLNSGILFTLLFSIPAMIIASKISNWELLFKLIYVIAVLNIVLAIYSYYLVIMKLGEYDGINYMAHSYNMLTSICLSTAFGFYYNKSTPIIIGLVGFIVILIIGSRGAMLAALIFYLLILYLRYKNERWFLPLLGMLVFICFLFVLFLGKITDSVNLFLKDFDVYSRTLTKMLDGELFDSSSRDNISECVIHAVKERPFIGYGLFGDRYITYSSGYSPIYVHNLIIEFLCNYGIILGPLLLLSLFYNIYKSYRYSNILIYKYILLALLPFGIIQLFFSISYLQNILFWIIVGFLFNHNIRHYEDSGCSNCL